MKNYTTFHRSPSSIILYSVRNPVLKFVRASELKRREAKPDAKSRRLQEWNCRQRTETASPQRWRRMDRRVFNQERANDVPCHSFPGFRVKDGGKSDAVDTCSGRL